MTNTSLRETQSFWKPLGGIGSNHPINLISPASPNIFVFFILE